MWDLAILFASLATTYIKYNVTCAHSNRTKFKRRNAALLRHVNYHQNVNDSAENLSSSNGGWEEGESSIRTRSAPRLTRSVQKLVRAIICDDPGYVPGDKPTASEIKFISLTDKHRDIGKHANFLKMRALVSNVRRKSNRAINPSTRRRNSLFQKNIGSARKSPNQTTRDAFDMDYFSQDRAAVIKSPYI